MDAAGLDTGGGLKGKDRVEVGFCLGELFASEPDVAQDRLRGTVGDTGVDDDH